MSLLPANATAFERALEAGTQALPTPVPLRDLWSADDCPVELLPWLAWSLSIQRWDSGWSEAEMRAQIKAAIPTHRIAGSVASVQDVLDYHDGQVTMVEWFDETPRADPYTFRLTLDVLAVAPEYRTTTYTDAVYKEVLRTKPVRAHYIFDQKLTASGAGGLIGGAKAFTYARLGVDAAPSDGSPDDIIFFTDEDGAYFTDEDGRFWIGAGA